MADLQVITATIEPLGGVGPAQQVAHIRIAATLDLAGAKELVAKLQRRIALLEDEMKPAPAPDGEA